jgi:DNA-binding GntR family transcriptional regulator
MNQRSAFAKRPRPRPKKPRSVGRHAVRERLILLIAKGDVGSGEKLVQFRLARRFGVSISLIREALLDLQSYGLIESDDNRGFFVRELDAKAVIDFTRFARSWKGWRAGTSAIGGSRSRPRWPRGERE